MSEIIYRDEVDNDIDGWKNENGVFPTGWYINTDQGIVIGPFKTYQKAVNEEYVYE